MPPDWSTGPFCHVAIYCEAAGNSYNNHKYLYNIISNFLLGWSLQTERLNNAARECTVHKKLDRSGSVFSSQVRPPGAGSRLRRARLVSAYMYRVAQKSKLQSFVYIIISSPTIDQFSHFFGGTFCGKWFCGNGLTVAFH